jgi:hypothetical protein
MHLRLLTLACLATATTFAAEAPKLPAITASGNEESERLTSFPEQPIAQKKELLFADDFEKAELGSAWKIVVPRLPNPNGIESSSPGLPASGYPRIGYTNRHQP